MKSLAECAFPLSVASASPALLQGTVVTRDAFAEDAFKGSAYDIPAIDALRAYL